MPVSRRLRYEILRRDGHTCRYCGASAPDVELTVDHVTPVALGGRDDPDNLVTACKPCNSGKTSTSPDAPLVADVENDALRWARAREQAITRWRDQHKELQDDIAAFAAAWDIWGHGEGQDRKTVPRGDNWVGSVERWIGEGFTIGDLTSFIEKAMRQKGVTWDDRWRYFCGIVWRTLDKIQDDTRSTVNDPPSSTTVAPTPAESAADAAYQQGYSEGWADGRSRLTSIQDGGPAQTDRAPLKCLAPSSPGKQCPCERNRGPEMCPECEVHVSYGATGRCQFCWQSDSEVGA